jgi:hypothetical protein
VARSAGVVGETGEIVPLAGSCRNGRRLLRSPERILAIDLADALSGVSTSTGRIGSVTGHSATRPRLTRASNTVWMGPLDRPHRPPCSADTLFPKNVQFPLSRSRTPCGVCAARRLTRIKRRLPAHPPVLAWYYRSLTDAFMRSAPNRLLRNWIEPFVIWNSWGIKESSGTTKPVKALDGVLPPHQACTDRHLTGVSRKGRAAGAVKRALSLCGSNAAPRPPVTDPILPGLVRCQTTRQPNPNAECARENGAGAGRSDRTRPAA